MLKKVNYKIFFRVLPIVICGVLSILLPVKPALAASVTVSPDSAGVDSLIHVSGTGFTPSVSYETTFAYSTSYEIDFSGTVLPDGTISHFLTVPEIPGGSYAVRVATSFESATDTFTVEPDIELNKTSATVGERVTIYGTGFRANRTVRIRFESSTVETTSTNSRGSFTETFTVPESEHGSHDVSADDSTYRISTNISVEQSISITPESGATSTEVTVNGTGFRGDRTIIITFEGDRVDTRPSSVRSDSDGSFVASFDVPTCINRTPEIEAGDGRYTASAEFTIIASLSVDPKSGVVGETTTITGHGFRSNRSIKITFDGEFEATQPASVRSDDTGCFDADFEVPPSASGVHHIEASDGSETAEVSFMTLPSITLNPSSGPINAEVTVSGSGFGSAQVVTIRFNGEHVRTSASDANGSFSDMFSVPPSSTGNYDVVASDSFNSATAVFTVTTSIDVSPQTGHVGTSITVHGNGFSGAIDIKYDEEVVATATADANGSFTVSFSAPASMHGHHDIVVSDAINTLTTVFTMESDPPPVPPLLLPENGSRQGSRPSFDWASVSDPSGVTYVLQIATDDSFGTLLLEKRGLTQSQYTLSKEEGLQQTDSETPYYWRVKAIDGAFNESDWSTPWNFYVRFLPQWALYVIIAAVSVLISVLASRRVFGKR